MDLSHAFLASALGHLDQVDEAPQVWQEFKAINPKYSHLDRIGRLPFKNQNDAGKLADGLRKAGLVE